MSGRVLVVDDLEPNRRLLDALLARDYCEVSFAASGREALQCAQDLSPELVLLDWRLPDIDGLEVCRRLKADPLTSDIPVVLVTAFSDREARLQALQAGADDFLTKPINALQLSARVRALVHLKRSMDEMRRRHAVGRRPALVEQDLGADLVLLSDPADIAATAAAALGPRHRVRVLSAHDFSEGAGDHCDVALIHLAAAEVDALRLVARLQARESTRMLQILCLSPADRPERAARALDLGAHDIVLCPADSDELRLRVATLARRKRALEAMQALIEESLEQAVTDPLTGLYNRRFLIGQLDSLLKRALHGGPPVGLVLFDIDHFKQINDQFGHDAGDAVLRELAARVAAQVRPTDFACRFGGEEFVVVLPGATLDFATVAAERLRLAMLGEPFRVNGGDRSLVVTISAGVAASEGEVQDGDQLLKMADQRLYGAKAAGRNRVAAA